ncbi:fibronectin type III domain-containing protein [Paenibacillus allorhizosphaerae]|nr:fibronectin type III domain-containing protein [Paenibacillus allorhizosphaerae]
MINDYSQITIVSPSPNQPVSELASVVPTVTVSDPEGGTLSVSYYLDSETAPRDTRIISNTATPQTVSFSALDISALSEGAHSLRFTSGSGSANTASETVSVLVDKSPPAIENVSYNSTETSISVSMTATDAISGLDSSPYRFTIDSEAGAWTTATSSEKNNLLPGTGYSVTLEAKDAVGHIASQVQRMYTKAQIPALSASQAGEDTLELSVSDGNPSATEYQLVANGQYVDASGNLTASPVWIAPVNKRITVKGLTPNTGYALQAKARNQIGEETAFSAAITATTLASPPVNLVVEPAQRSIKVTWPTTAGASYDIEADGVRIDNGTSTTYVHSGLEPETQHSYRVRVRNAGGTGNWSTSITPFTLPYPPAVPSNILTSPQQTEMTVTWDTVARAVSYDVKADGSVTEMTQTSFVHRGLQPLTNHTYQIRARNAGGVSEWSQPVESRTLPYPPSVPANVTAQPAIRNVTVTWDSTEGADAYEIYVDGLRMDNGAATSYVHEGLDPLTGHTYQVRAKNAGGYSAWSQPIHVTTHPEKPLTPTNIISTSDETAINVMWFKPANTDSYEVEIDGQSIVTVLDNSYIHTGLAPESKHSYRIRAKNISGYSDWSAVASMTTLPQHSEEGMSLTNMVAVVTNRFITVSWDTVAVNAQYEIEVDGVLQNIGKDTVYQHAGLKANEFHTYKIRLINNDKPSQWVAILSLSTLPDPPDAPEGLEAVATNTSIELHWKKITGADGYDIEIDGKTVSAGADVTYLHTPLAPGTAHTYRIRAKNITGVTAWSPSLVKSTTSPTYIVNGVKDKTFDLSLLAANVQDFSELTFEVTYNPDQLEVVDLYNYTPNADTASGSIPGSNLMVEYAPGKIVYRVKQNIVPGTSWSGEITGIVFKSKIDGQSSMDVIVK